MRRNITLLLVAQFVTAFADNAILFAAIAMVMQSSDLPGWYVPSLQASFLIAFVVLAAWVGDYADTRPKARVLTSANLIKAVGALLMVAHVEPLLAYAVVGVGAAMYSPAKYGILPELVGEEALVKLNGWVEGSTILAILGGSLVGAALADRSVLHALLLVVVLYGISAVVAAFITGTVPRSNAREAGVARFGHMMRGLLATSRARFSTLGVSLFWAAAAVLRVALVAWAPVVLYLTHTAEVAELTLYSALGIAGGAIIASRLIPLRFLRRARMAGYLMGASIVILSAVDTVWLARGVLLATGLAGGLFVVPINAALQDIGHRSVGAGGAVAVQQFFENLAMLAATGLYALAAAEGADPVASILVLGVAVVVATALVSWHLPPDPATADAVADAAD